MDNQTLKDGLATFNLSKTEAELVHELLNRGTTRIGTLIKACNKHRGTVYNCMNQLIAKGFVSVSPAGGATHYSINEDAFLGVIEQHRHKIDSMAQCVQEIRKIKQLTDTMAQKPDTPLRMSYGPQSFKNFFTRLLNENAAKDATYLTYCNGGEISRSFGDDYYKFTQDLKTQLGSDSRILLNAETRTQPYSKYIRGNIKWVRGVRFPSQCFVHNKKYYMVDWSSQPMVVIEIESKEMAASQQEFFDSLWKNKAISAEERQEMGGVVAVCDDKTL
jgi:sugar-specific transcriptional regulator TrmB